MNATLTPAAPSATPAAAPVIAAALAAPAPSAAAPLPVVTSMADALDRAVKSFANAQAAPASEPAGQEPPPAEPAVPASAEPPAPDPTEPPAEPTVDAEGDEPEVSAEVQATWTDREKQIYGVLKKQREQTKEAKKGLKEEKAARESLEAKVNELIAKSEKPAEAPAPAPSPLPTAAGPLAQCRTFEAVDAAVAEANRVELLTHDLQDRLARNELEPVLAALTKEGVKNINGVPLAEANTTQLGDFLSAAFKGSRITQHQAPSRKQFLVSEDKALSEAVTLLPGLKDANSEEFKTFKAIADANPWVKSAGPNWPVVLARYVRGAKTEAAAAPATTAPKTAVIPKVEIVPPAPTRKAPGAPGKTGAALPHTTELDAARERIRTGIGATMADVQMIAKAGLETAGTAPTRV